MLIVGIKMAKKEMHVWCFVGDGATDSGRFFEAVRYAWACELPITFIIEDNRLSCDTPREVRWPKEELFVYNRILWNNIIGLDYYEYERIFPHTGSKTWGSF